jgi:CSLREA domain-containing protein
MGANSGPAVFAAWRDVGIFMALAYLFSWIWWGGVMGMGIVSPANLSQASGDEAQMAQILIALGNFGPLLAALIMRLGISREGVRGTMGWRRSWQIYAVAMIAPVIFYAGVVLINHLSGIAPFVWANAEMPLWRYLAIELLIGGLIISVFILGEEVGWRGYLLPKLLPLGEVRATVAVGLIWAGWHLIIGLVYGVFKRPVAGLILAGLLLVALPAQAQEPPGIPQTPQATIVVNSLGDERDPDTGDGRCDITGMRNPETEYSGICTLRAAIMTANNASAGASTISFSVVGTIQPATSPLTTIYAPLIIEGSGQVLDGSLLTESTYAGLSTSTTWGKGGTSISGLVIQKFNFAGIALADPVGGNLVYNTVLKENGTGITVASNTPDNTIEDNEIYQNTGTGIVVNSSGNTIQGNAIGTDNTGIQDKGNGGHGIRLGGQNNLVGSGAGTPFNCFGGSDCNLIAGNAGSGIYIAQGGATSGVNNTVRGNFIGVNRNGIAALPNDGNGIRTNGDNNQIIGNLISGNGTPTANDGNHGVYLEAGAVGNTLQGNLIGSAINGEDRVGNYGAGIYVYYANQNTIGAGPVSAASVTAPPATCAGSCNLILGNSAGISITQATSPGSNSIIGNYIGVGADGASAPGNTGNGIFLQAMTTTIASNVIGGNGGNGIEMLGVSVGGLRPSNYNTITGNHIGVGPDGSANLGNRGHGILIDTSADNWIGGLTQGEGNIIAHNGSLGGYDGIALVESFTYDLAAGNRFLGNSVYDNGGVAGGIGIDLRRDGPTANDSDDDDGGPNHLQNYPVIDRVRGATVAGSLTSTPNTTFRLEFFGSPTCSPSGYGQGKTFLDTFDVATGATGVITFEQTLASTPGTQRLTATATGEDGSTSEFSACYNKLIVNSTGDRSDAAWDGFCDTGQLNASGDPECTLRAALEEANLNADLSTILFDIPFAVGLATIAPQSRLPDVNHPVIIDATSQPGVDIWLTGSQAGANVDGLRIYGGGSTVRGLNVIGFGGYGLALYQNGDNVIVGNRVGVDPTGSANGNGRAGIAILGGDNNRIGGNTPAEANIIGANGAATGSSGILIESQSRGNQILGNFIGVLPDGTLRGNQVAGVYINGSPDNLVGGGISTPLSCSAPCNVMGGNQYGAIISGTLATDNTIKGNFVGVYPGGTASANTEWGVVVNNAPGNTIAHNIISGNGQAADPESGDGVVINGAGATGNTVSANYIGVTVSGNAALANRRHGVWLEQSPSNTVQYNLISGNGGSGVAIHGSAATGNTVHSNRIGANASGSAAIPNGGDGVRIDGASNNTIGSALTPGTGSRGLDGLVPIHNLLSGNTGHGVQITSSASQNNQVLGNQIGVNATGSAALPNGGDGVRIGDGASMNTVGGLAAGDADANVIAGNSGDGVRLDGAGTSGNTVAGNFIGVLADGETPHANGGHGVQISNGASSNTVGGGVSDHGNSIAYNGGDGVFVAAGSSNAIWQNRIWSNSGLGIDLGSNGPDANDALDGDGGANQGQNYPLLASVQVSNGSATLKGTLKSSPSTTYTLAFYGNSACDPSGFGEGEMPLSGATVATDENGWAVFDLSIPVTQTMPVGFTTTATDANRNTSEFSPCAGSSSEAVITPGGGGTVAGNGVSVVVPPGAVAEEFTLTLLPLPAPTTGLPGTLNYAGTAFLLNAFVGGVPQPGWVFQQPVLLTVNYNDEAVAGLDEDALTLQTWDGAAWMDAATTCTPPSAYDRQPAANQISVGICHLSEYALVEGGAAETEQAIYLPLVTR